VKSFFNKGNILINFIWTYFAFHILYFFITLGITLRGIFKEC
jgi:hypothetical protein